MIEPQHGVKALMCLAVACLGKCGTGPLSAAIVFTIATGRLLAGGYDLLGDVTKHEAAHQALRYLNPRAAVAAVHSRGHSPEQARQLSQARPRPSGL